MPGQQPRCDVRSALLSGDQLVHRRGAVDEQLLARRLSRERQIRAGLDLATCLGQLSFGDLRDRTGVTSESETRNELWGIGFGCGLPYRRIVSRSAQGKHI